MTGTRGFSSGGSSERPVPTECDLVGRSQATTKARALLRQLAELRVPTVLLLGQPGTGKGRAARYLHAVGDFRGKFVAVNVASIDNDTAADSLFGHGKGAFTGAIAARPGLADEAQGGVLFLDEIGLASLHFQAVLLRFIENREIRPVGSDAARSFDGVVVLATNADLDAEVAAGRFRVDLLARISGEVLTIPPLSARREDIPPLVAHLLGLPPKEAQERGIAPPPRGPWVVTPRALSLLQQHVWHDNVRALVQVLARITRSLKDRESTVRAYHVREQLEGATGHLDAIRTLKEVDAAAAADAVEACKGNLSKAAELLGISRRRLRRYLGR